MYHLEGAVKLAIIVALLFSIPASPHAQAQEPTVAQCRGYARVWVKEFNDANTPGRASLSLIPYDTLANRSHVLEVCALSVDFDNSNALMEVTVAWRYQVLTAAYEYEMRRRLQKFVEQKGLMDEFKRQKEIR